MAPALRTGLSRLLDVLYRMSSSLAAVFLAGIAVAILVQVVSRLVGFRIAGLDEFAAWSMGAAVFLALPDTLARGAHIRVTLVLEHLPSRIARWLEAIAGLIGTAVCVWAAWAVLVFVGNTFRFGDLAQGEVAIPLWLPQISMAIGFVLLSVAFIENLAVTPRRERRDTADVKLHEKQIEEGF